MTEIQDIKRFLLSCAPFDRAGDDCAGRMAAHCEILYFRKGASILKAGASNDHLYLVRSGAVELYERDVDFSARLDEGSFFAFPSLLRAGPVRNSVRALEDTLIYRFAGEVFKQCLVQADSVRTFFLVAEADRLREAVNSAKSRGERMGLSGAAQFLDQPISTLITRAPVTAPPDLTVATAARVMTAEDVSSLLICQEGKLVGMVSDKDIRIHYVAEGRDADTTLADIMRPKSFSFTPDAPIFDALITIMQSRHRHIPIVDIEGSLTGVISGSDLMNQLASNGLQLVRAVQRATSREDVVSCAKDLPRLVVDLHAMGLTGVHVARVLSAVGRAIHRRLFQLAIEDIGPPPVAMAFVCFGSLARGEQSALSDQDNGFILSDDYDAEAHGTHIQAMASYICDGLNACGYSYCGGGIMATNDTWRQPLAVWKGYFEQWMEAPEPKALMHSAIFFDMTHVDGESTLVEALRSHVVDRTRNAGIFLAHMTENALLTKPPIGFFRQFVVSRHGEHDHMLNIKKRAIVPLQDIARVHSLAHGVKTVNTLDRLETLKTSSKLSPADLDEMADAFRFLMQIRLKNQAAQIDAGDTADNFINPDQLTRFEREHLRAAFRLLQIHQDGLSRAYAGGRY